MLDSARWRHDLESWRHRTSGPEGESEGFASEDHDDADWPVVPHLHADYHPSYRGYAWFRGQCRAARRASAGEVVTIGLGGMDDEDWLAYRVFLNGTEIEAWESPEGWREAHRIRLEPDDPRYRLVRFGEPNLLAVEARDLKRPTDGVSDDEAEHLFYHGWLLDQFVATGEPFAELAEHEVLEVREGGDGALDVDLRMRGDAGIEATIAYRADGDRLHKRITLHNRRR